MYNKRSFAVLPHTVGGLMEDLFHNGWNRINEEISSFTVPVNIQETEKSYELQVIAAGLKKEDFKLTIDKNVLQIAYDHKEENKENGSDGKWLRTEFKMKSFKRSFTMNDKVDTSKISAKYNEGILQVTLPKKETTEPSIHEISVN